MISMAERVSKTRGVTGGGVRPRDSLGHTLPLPGGRLVGFASVLKTSGETTEEAHVPPDVPEAALEQGPETRLEGARGRFPVEEASAVGVPGPAGPGSRRLCLLRPLGPALFPDGPLIAPTPRAALTPNQTPRSDADPSLLSLKPVGTSGQLDLTSAGLSSPLPSASTASPSLWTRGPLLLWLAAPPPRPAWPPRQGPPTICGPSKAAGSLKSLRCARALQSV